MTSRIILPEFAITGIAIIGGFGTTTAYGRTGALVPCGGNPSGREHCDQPGTCLSHRAPRANRKAATCGWNFATPADESRPVQCRRTGDAASSSSSPAVLRHPHRGDDHLGECSRWSNWCRPHGVWTRRA